MAAGFRSISITGSAVLLYCAAVAFVPGIVGSLAGEALPDRNGFGDAIQFTSGPTAEALLPVEPQPLPDRPGFGYIINFLQGDPSDSLYPPGWVAGRAPTKSPQG